MLRSLVCALSLAVSSFLYAGTVFVTTAADSGRGSLRQAILDANASGCRANDVCVITFAENFRGVIRPQSPLPAVTKSYVRIAAVPGDSFARQVIEIDGRAAGPDADGFRVENARNVEIYGLHLDGFAKQGLMIFRSTDMQVAVRATNNGDNGVAIVQSERILFGGGLIASNKVNGIFVTTSRDIEINNTTIGGDAERVAGGNGANGIHLNDVQRSHGSFNIIRNNAHVGLLTTGPCERCSYEYNQFRDNGGLGIDRDANGVSGDDIPIIETATYNRGWMRVKGRVRSLPNARVRVQISLLDEPDETGFGEGWQPILPLVNFEEMHIQTDQDGRGSFTWAFEGDREWLPTRNRYVTATATRVIDARSGLGETSEFSRSVKVVDDEIEYVVTTTADAGGGSLRSAIGDANAGECAVTYPCGIAFRIGESPSAAGVFTIRPRTELPPVQRSGIWIDGFTQTEFSGDSNAAGPEIEIDGSLCSACNGLRIGPGPARVADVVVRDLIINRFAGDGIVVVSGDQLSTVALIDGSYIGTDPTGGFALPNGGSGIRSEDAIVYAGTWFLRGMERRTARNVISGNAINGMTIEGGFAGAYSNYIGTDRGGFFPIPNGGSGIVSSGRGEISRNTIAFNRERGVLVLRPELNNNVAGNSIHSNGGLGIEHATEVQKAPEILSAVAVGDKTHVTVRVETPHRGYTHAIRLYAGSFADGSGAGEGHTPVATVFSVGGNKIEDVVIERNLGGKFLSATAELFDLFPYVGIASTSQFGAAVQVAADVCSPDAPSLVEPANDAQLSGQTRFAWNGVPGASLYILWSMKPGDMPRRLFEGAATETSITLPPGRYEWWVEARFESCYGTQSEHRYLTR